MGDLLLALLCGSVTLVIFVGLMLWVVDILGAPFRAWRRHEVRQQEMLEHHRRLAAQQESATLERDDATKAAEIIRQATGEPPPEQPHVSRPKLRLIPGGPATTPPPELVDAEVAPPVEPKRQDLPPAGLLPWASGEYRLELPDPAGLVISIRQRRYVRALLRQRGAELGRDLTQFTTAEAEVLVTALGGDPRQLYRRGWRR